MTSSKITWKVQVESPEVPQYYFRSWKLLSWWWILAAHGNPASFDACTGWIGKIWCYERQTIFLCKSGKPRCRLVRCVCICIMEMDNVLGVHHSTAQAAAHEWGWSVIAVRDLNFMITESFFLTDSVTELKTNSMYGWVCSFHYCWAAEVYG